MNLSTSGTDPPIFRGTVARRRIRVRESPHPVTSWRHLQFPVGLEVDAVSRLEVRISAAVAAAARLRKTLFEKAVITNE